MSKPWNPRRETVKLGKSRIRRDPVRIDNAVRPAEPKTAVRTPQEEMWTGVAGILLITGAIAVAAVGISAVSIPHFDPAAAVQSQKFGQCYNSAGPNCVLDGGNIIVGGEKIVIAGVDAPQIQGAACPVEGSLGIDATGRLADLLNSGPVTISASFQDAGGREVRTVRVKDRDVADTMIGAGLARRWQAEKHHWCGAGSGETSQSSQ